MASSDGVHGLIKRGAQVINSIPSMAFNSQRDGLSKFQFEQIVRAVEVSLGESGVSVIIFREGLNFPIEFGSVILCPSDTVF